MPAVQLARLKTELARLSALSAQPGEFKHALDDLFSLYADRTYRPGQTVPPASLTPLYHIPALVTQQLRLELRPLCLSQPEQALAIADLLWQDSFQEPRRLAAFLLGQVPVSPPDTVLARLDAMSAAASDPALLRALLDEGSARLRREQSAAWLAKIGDWLSSREITRQKAGLTALLALAKDRAFENLPPLFRLATPLLQSAAPPFQPLLQELLESLLKRSPVETLYFAKQLLATAPVPALVRLLRKLQPLLPPENQDSLRQALSPFSGEK